MSLDISSSSNGARQSISTKVARNLALPTKTVPQMLGVTPRWLLTLLPWVPVDAGMYHVNRRKIAKKRDGRVEVMLDNGQPHIEATQLRHMALFRELDESVLSALGRRFVVERHNAGEVITREGEPRDKLYVIANGKAELHTMGLHGERLRLGVLTDGDQFGQRALFDEDLPRTATVSALTACTVLTLQRNQFRSALADRPDQLEVFMRAANESMTRLRSDTGESPVDVMSGHEEELDLTETFVDYEDAPREYELSIVQTILRVHTRVTDLYNNPIDQLREQLRLTIETMKEQQEREMINNRDFGLLHSAAPSMRLTPRKGAPTPDDMDELLSHVWKEPSFFLAHPRAIAAFGRECTRRGVPPPTVQMYGGNFLTWRGVPLFPCDKLGIDGKNGSTRAGTTNILLMRAGEKKQGVVGLHQAISADPSQSLSVRFMGINKKGVASYLLTLYFSLAVLTDDALGVLEKVEVGNYHDYE